jgi:hypothetical protein
MHLWMRRGSLSGPPACEPTWSQAYGVAVLGGSSCQAFTCFWLNVNMTREHRFSMRYGMRWLAWSELSHSSKVIRAEAPLRDTSITKIEYSPAKKAGAVR